ncbi:hypothetical protein GDO81_025925 [Engystomops pustulosus]|uniref:Uncharacterized protein n=1 Tax=Engystomops pustulosus TaxID=76066 RepID=A0AAV6YNA3_ENGPU|nr:hypothetical protein GDO81_025925 [Engystomops pustulosus]
MDAGGLLGCAYGGAPGVCPPCLSYCCFFISYHPSPTAEDKKKSGMEKTKGGRKWDVRGFSTEERMRGGGGCREEGGCKVWGGSI